MEGVAQQLLGERIFARWLDVPRLPDGGGLADFRRSRRELQTLVDTARLVALEPVERQGAGILDELFEFCGRFIAYPSRSEQVAHALWIAHTRFMEAWESTPRTAFLAPEPTSGQTRAIEVTELLVPNPVQTVNVTAACLFRKVGDTSKTSSILYDEIDTVFGPKAKDNEEIRGLLNAGHRRGAVAGRCVMKGRTVETEEISAFAPVALAGLGGLLDTILSGSVVVRMKPRARSEQLDEFRRRVQTTEGYAIRDRLVRWATTALDEAREAWPEMPENVADRDADLWEPLLAVADLAGGDGVSDVMPGLDLYPIRQPDRVNPVNLAKPLAPCVPGGRDGLFEVRDDLLNHSSAGRYLSRSIPSMSASQKASIMLTYRNSTAWRWIECDSRIPDFRIRPPRRADLPEERVKKRGSGVREQNQCLFRERALWTSARDRHG
jgi:hypothetical protein